MNTFGKQDTEAPFVGASRLALVDRLMEAFDGVSSSGTPRLFTLEGLPGWGKTRVVQEFYKRLVAERQRVGGYWPPSLTSPGGGTRLGPAPRKQIYPEHVEKQPGVLPNWFWWGISCGTRSGTPFQALADDLTQLDTHQIALRKRWGQLSSPKQKAAAQLAFHTSELKNAAAEELLAQLIASLLKASVPVVGTVASKASLGALHGVKRIYEESKSSPHVYAADRGRSDLVHKIVPTVRLLAAAGLPVVVVVEDLHHSDESLVETLAQLLCSDTAAIMVIATGWPGLLEELDRPAHKLFERVPASRMTRIRVDEMFGNLDVPDLLEIVRSNLPQMSVDSASLLVERYPNPWALQLACKVGWVRRRSHELGKADLEELPVDISGLTEMLWELMPESSRNALQIAALCTPIEINGALGLEDSRWDPSLLRAASQLDPWLFEHAGDLVAELGRDADSYNWVRMVDDRLQCFHDSAQERVAVSHSQMEYGSYGRRLVYAAVAKGLLTCEDTSPGQKIHHDELVVALACGGFLDWDEKAIQAAVSLCGALLALPDVKTLNLVIRIVQNVMQSETLTGSVAPNELLVTLRTQYGMALGRTGDARKAAEIFQGLVEEYEASEDATEFAVLDAAAEQAYWLAECGRAEDAIGLYAQLLQQWEPRLGSDHPDILTIRNNLQVILAQRGTNRDLASAFERLLVERTQSLGRDDRETLRTRASLAYLIGDSGRPDDALVRLDLLLADQRRVLGPDDADVLTTRAIHAMFVARSGRSERAIIEFQDLLVDQERVLGKNAPDTLSSRANIATLLGELGQTEEAVGALRQLVREQEQAFGAENPRVLACRNNLACLLDRLNQFDDSLTEHRQLLRDQMTLWGEDHTLALRTRSNIAAVLSSMGRHDEALSMLRPLLEDQQRVLGPDDPSTLNSRVLLAILHGELASLDMAVVELEQVLRQQMRVLGQGHPDIFRTEMYLAYMLTQANRRAEAISLYEEMLADQARLFGKDYRDSLTVRGERASLLWLEGRTAEAIAEYKELLSDEVRLLGHKHPQTCATRARLFAALDYLDL